MITYNNDVHNPASRANQKECHACSSSSTTSLAALLRRTDGARHPSLKGKDQLGLALVQAGVTRLLITQRVLHGAAAIAFLSPASFFYGTRYANNQRPVMATKSTIS